MRRTQHLYQYCRRIPALLACSALAMGLLSSSARAQSTGSGATDEPAGTAPAPLVQEKPPDTPLSPAEKANQQLIKRLLTEAEGAYRAGRLTEPSHDNAYDRFQSVLILEPQNQLARAGVQAVLLNYTDRIRKALKDGHGDFAAQLMRSAETYYPANNLLMDLKKDIARVRAQEDVLLLQQQPADSERVEFPLPTGALSRKSPAVTDYLARIAERLKETDESILIYARTDAEGRWIYSQLKQASPGYRVRGDIKISQSPKISILPPLH